MGEITHDIAIAGGGLAGLSLAILMRKQGYSVILFEKEKYPFHKVCGEYISMESWNFLESLGVPLSSLDLPIIHNLKISSPNGNMLEHPLHLGGFGISRYTLDNKLKNIAVESGVQVLESCKVNNIQYKEDRFYLATSSGIYTSKVCAGSFGKRSNIDVSWKRRFLHSKKRGLENYIGIKYHVKYPVEKNTIALHNFKDGYCGISSIENNKACLCYLTTAKNLKNAGANIERMEKDLLSKNKHLAEIFANAEKLYSQPLSISQISFTKKTSIENHVLMLGDAAGMITPLCGNGMSMALHSSKIASTYISAFLKGDLSRNMMEIQYAKAWKKQFSSRLFTGRLVQRFFGAPGVTDIFISFMKKFPTLTTMLIRKTHGRPF